MSRRDTIIISVLVNACLLIILFSTATSSKESVFSSSSSNKLGPTYPSVVIEDVEKSLVKESSFAPSSPKLLKPETVNYSKESSYVALAETKALPVEIKNHLEVTVKRGDFLEKIAKENGTYVDDIMKLNQMASTQLQIGQVLKIPLTSSKDIQNTSKSKVRQYEVKAGDSIWKIANEQKMKEDELLKINHMNKESAKRIKAGDLLLIR